MSKKLIKPCALCERPFSYWPSRSPKATYCSIRCAKTRPDPVADFHSRVNKSRGQGPDGDCWQWQGGISDERYGAFYWKGKQTGTHRVAFEIANKSIDPNLMVLHRCDNPPCCNPSHLFQGTTQDNMDDKVQKGRIPRGASHYTVIGKKEFHVSD